MFRKTFICVAGVLAGVSAGAWSDGFFDQQNVVTDSINQSLEKLGFAGEAGGADIAPTADEAEGITSLGNTKGISKAADAALVATSNTADSQSAIDQIDAIAELSANGDTKGSAVNAKPISEAGKSLDINPKPKAAAPKASAKVAKEADKPAQSAAEMLIASNDATMDELQKTLDEVAKAMEDREKLVTKKKLEAQQPPVVESKEDAAVAAAEKALAEAQANAKSVAKAKSVAEAEAKAAEMVVANAKAAVEAKEAAKAKAIAEAMAAVKAKAALEAKAAAEAKATAEALAALEAKEAAERAAKLAIERARIEAEQAAAAELERAQALVGIRFTEEVYESPSGGKLLYRKLTPRTQGDELLPLVIFLHGKGERGDDNELQLKYGLRYFASAEGMRDFPATIIAPQCPADQFWSDTLKEKEGAPKMRPQPTAVTALVMELLDSIQLTDPIDSDRIYLTGLSMGGFGTFDLVARRPQAFAAAAPLCGGGDSKPAIAKRLTRTPMWVIHGSADKSVNVERSREMVYAMEAAGAAPRYSELEDFGHNVWDAAYSDSELYNWMFNQSLAGVINPDLERKQVVNAMELSDSDEQAKMASEGAAKAAATPTPADPSQQVTANARPLIGQWKVLAASQKGQQARPKVLEDMKVIVEGDKFIIQMGDKQEIANFRLSESEKVKQIDILSNRKGIKSSKGIYQINGEKLIICWGMPGQARPTKFVNLVNVKSLVLEKQ